MAKARSFCGLTQQQMAERLKIHRRSITRYEASDDPPYPMIVAYAHVTEIPESWIAEGELDPEGAPLLGRRVSRCTRAPWEIEGYRYLDAA